MPTESLSPIRPSGEAESPLYRSRYGGLWIDRRDAHDLLQARLARGEVTQADAENLAQYIDHGYVVFPNAIDVALVDEYLDLFESAWEEPPSALHLHWKGQFVPMERRHYDEVTKVNDLHHYFAHAGELIFPPLVLRFLTQIYDRPPVAFQTMTMRKGSEESLHIDTGPLTLTEPMSMAASWAALEDVQTSSGEFQFVPGSHALPELLHYGTDKGHHGDYTEYDLILKTTLRMCDERGLKTEKFMAKKGDVLIWHADLMHGGAPIDDLRRTRKSLAAHFMPLGVMPTFIDFAQVSAFPYTGGGYCLDAYWRDTTREQQRSGAFATPAGKIGPIDLWRSWVPVSARRRVPPSFATWARARFPNRQR